MTKQQLTKQSLKKLDELHELLLDESPTADMDEAEDGAFRMMRETIAELRSLLRKTETLK